MLKRPAGECRRQEKIVRLGETFKVGQTHQYSSIRNGEFWIVYSITKRAVLFFVQVLPKRLSQ